MILAWQTLNKTVGYIILLQSCHVAEALVSALYQTETSHHNTISEVWHTSQCLYLSDQNEGGPIWYKIDVLEVFAIPL